MGLDGDLMASTDNQFATTSPLLALLPMITICRGETGQRTYFGTLINLQFSKKTLKRSSCTPALSVYFDDFQNDVDISNYEGGGAESH